jgi:hypothetical protein
MSIVPSVVIGLGSSGAYVVANLERILYEVLGDAKLDLVKLLVIETAQTRKDDDAPPGGKRSSLVYAHEPEVGQAIQNLKAVLQNDFQWCPPDLRISGQGAGNIRAGGRLMLFSKFANIRQAISDALHETHEAAGRPGAAQELTDQYARRGIAAPDNLVNANEQMVYVVGTLAGGTCSGMCVDLGYLIRDINPGASRTGIFFVPDRSAAPTFQENTWAALKDLEYFCENPASFNATWPLHRQAHPYQGGPAKPYDQAYLLSPLNQRRQQRLEYQTNPNAPLIVMAATQLAADLLGMASIRSERLVNMNQHVDGPEKRRMFLNFNVRAISYPKYEISEAAASKVVAETLCGSWLNSETYIKENGESTNIRKSDRQGRGADQWNREFPAVWARVSASIDLDSWVSRVADGNVDQPVQEAVHQLTSEKADTFYSKASQNIPKCVADLQGRINEGLAAVSRETANLTCMRLYLQGVKEQVERTLAYWRELETPQVKDDTAWLRVAKDIVRGVFEAKGSVASGLLGARPAILRSGMEEALTRLAMFLLRDRLSELSEWITNDRIAFVDHLEATLRKVQSLAGQQHQTILNRLRDQSGPVLKLPRSKRDSFEQEITNLATEGKAFVRGKYLEFSGDAFSGAFIARGDRSDDHSSKILLALRGPIQSRFLTSLSDPRNTVDIAEQIISQDRLHQAEIHWLNTYELSIATELTLDRRHTTVPSYIAAKDVATSQRLEHEMRQRAPGLEAIENKSLPMFDHMAILYQEGAGFEPDTLFEAGAFRKCFDAKMANRADHLDPLRFMKNGPDESQRV